MALKAIYESIGEIPEPHRELFTERDGRYELTGVEGIKTQADADRLQAALAKERAATKAVKDRLAAWGELKPDEVLPILDRVPELEAAAAGNIDEAKLNEIVESRLRTKTAPLERDLKKIGTEREELASQVLQYQERERQRAIHDSVRSAAMKAKAVDTAHEDILLLAERVFEVNEDGTVTTRDNVGMTPGLAPEAWLSEMQQRRPHWWPASQGTGARGSGVGIPGGGPNPWSAEHWNMTTQGALLRSDPQLAERLAKAAGTTVGGKKPVRPKAV